jgi:ribonuclease HI
LRRERQQGNTLGYIGSQLIEALPKRESRRVSQAQLKQFEESKTAGKDVRIHRITAHSKVTGNEKANELAKHRIRHRRNI